MPLLTITALTLIKYSLLYKQDSAIRLETKNLSQEQEKIEPPLSCSTCNYPITAEDQAVSRAASHHHTFFNPAGIVFEISCFQEASGCHILGKPTAEFSWFPHYHWQYAACSNCQAHLGWYFSAPAVQDIFFGLIANKVVKL